MVSTRRQAALGLSSSGSHVAATATTRLAQSSSSQIVPLARTPAPLDGDVDSKEVAKPPAKRRKSRKWTVAMKESALLVRESNKLLIRSFMQLPLDIVLEMFGHLHPRTLLAIGRTSKELRAMVFSKRLADVWKKSREGYGVPEPAEGFSEPRWASMLFDTKRCQVCWKLKASDVDWYFLRRACGDCLRLQTLYFPLSGPSWYPHDDALKAVDIEILECIPWRRHAGTDSYWRDDVVEVVKMWRGLSGLTDLPGRMAFQQWKMQRREMIRKNYSMIPTYHLWNIYCLYPSKTILKHKAQRSLEEDRWGRLQEIKSRLREVGYRQEDIDLCKRLDHNNHPRAALSDSGWIQLRPNIEPQVKQLRDFRVALEMELVTHERLLILKGVYQEFLRTLPPSEQYRCPPVRSLRIAGEIVSILESHKSITVTPAHFRLVAAKMRTFIDEAQGHLKQDLEAAARSVGRRSYRYMNPTQLQVPQEPWLLARNVFGRCWSATDEHPSMAKDRILVGWDMIVTHSYHGHSKVWLRPGVPVAVPRAFEFNLVASRDSQVLIDVAGLPNTVTVETMDEHDPRFVCQQCLEGMRNSAVFTWRAALVHLHETGHRDSASMRMATPFELKAAKDYEGAAREKVKAWACNRCPRYLEASDADTKAAVLAHLADEHKLTDPQMPRDFFVNERCRHAYEIPYTIAGETSASSSAVVE